MFTPTFWIRQAADILSATEIIFKDKYHYRPTLSFEMDGLEIWISSSDIQEIFYNEKYIEVRIAFIDKLLNPAKLLNSVIARSLDIPKELKLKAAMDAVS